MSSILDASLGGTGSVATGTVSISPLVIVPTDDQACVAGTALMIYWAVPPRCCCPATGCPGGERDPSVLDELRFS